LHKKAIGEDIKTVQFGWPLGMPLVEKLEPYGQRQLDFPTSDN
jgi:hypothetical protein